MPVPPASKVRKGASAWWVFPLLYGGVLLFCAVFYWREATLIEKSTQDLERTRVDMFGRLFQDELQKTTTDLRGLASVDSLRTYLTKGDPEELNRATRRAVMLSRLHPEYDHIQFLDAQGQELMRVNQHGQIVPAEALRNAADQEFFRQAIAVEAGKTYIAALDLSTVQGRLEEPFKPIWRFATPIFDNLGQRRGVYVIGYLGNSLVHRLQQVRPDVQDRLRLLNSRGYWLKAGEPAQEWGFVVPGRSEFTLDRAAPEVWARMMMEPQGAAGWKEGMISWARVDLRQSVKGRPESVVLGEEYVVLASEIPAGDFAALFTNIRLVFGVLTGLLLAATVVVDSLLRARWRGQLALQRSEENLAVTLDSIGDAVMATDAQRRVTRLNPVAEQLTGWSQAEAAGRPIEEVFRIINEETRQPAVIPVDSVLTTGEIHGLANHTMLIARDGTERPIADSAAPIRGAAGQILGVVLVFRDVTEDRRAEREIQRLNESLERRVRERTAELAQVNESLQQSEHRFRALIEHSGDSIAVVDGQNKILYLSPAVASVEGYTAEELIGRNGLENTHPDDLPVVQEVVGKLLARPGQPIPVLWRRRHKDGRWLWLEGVAVNLLDDPAVRGIVTNYRDVTERQAVARQQAAFAKLSQRLNETATATAAASLIAEVADELFGWDACSLDVYAEEEALIYPIINLDTVDGQRTNVPPAYVGQPPSPLARTVLAKGAQLILREGVPQFSGEAAPFGDKGRPSASLMFVPIRRGEHALGILSIQSYTPKAYDEKALQLLQSLADQCGGALERVRAEQSLRILNEQLEQRVQKRTEQLAAANKELESFSYSVSHDLRAPLRHIDGFVGMVQKEAEAKLSPGGQRYLGIVSESAKRMGTLIDDLLLFSRIGRAEMHRSRVRTADLVDQVLHEMTSDTAGRQIQWDIGELPEVVGDRSLLKQVWYNLLSNAVKYTGQREVATIRVTCRTNEKGEWEFMVQDNGAGFDMRYVGKLFGVFQRLHRMEDFEGTGIGLANVQRIVSRHGGRVWAEGKLNEGATFHFTLPPAVEEGRG